MQKQTSTDKNRSPQPTSRTKHISNALHNPNFSLNEEDLEVEINNSSPQAQKSIQKASTNFAVDIPSQSRNKKFANTR